MNELHLFAGLNLAVCVAIAFIAVCRLVAMDGDVLYRVQSEYAAYIAGAIAAGLQPMWGEWPRWGSLSIACVLLLGLLCSSHAWRRPAGDGTVVDAPPAVATDHAPLEPNSETNT